jgi:hypothetical protein
MRAKSYRRERLILMFASYAQANTAKEAKLAGHLPLAQPTFRC